MTEIINHSDTDPIQIDHNDGERQVIITPENQDRFVMTCAKAVEYCELSNSFNIFKSDLLKLMEHCAAWAGKNKDRIREVFVGPHEYRVGVFVIPQSEHFDVELAERVAELSHEIGRAYPAVRAEAIEVPGHSKESQRCFVNTDKMTPVYGPASKSPQQVDA